MKERPIIMNGNHPKLILDGTKTQTRRVIKPQPKVFGYYEMGATSNSPTERRFSKDVTKLCPYGQVGDFLRVRETWRIIGKDSGKIALEIQYKADMARRWVVVSLADFNKYTYDTGWGVDSKWKPSIHMPRWASRILLEITEIRAERLQEITHDDIVKEGIIPMPYHSKVEFQRLWDSLNAERGYGWDKNSWVWVIGFKVLRQLY